MLMGMGIANETCLGSFGFVVMVDERRLASEWVTLVAGVEYLLLCGRDVKEETLDKRRDLWP